MCVCARACACPCPCACVSAMTSLLSHVAVERAQLQGVNKSSPATIRMLVALLEKLGPLVNHPGLMTPHAIDSIGKYLDPSNFDTCRAHLVGGIGVKVTYCTRMFDVLSCDAVDKLPTDQRRQCIAVRGTNEMARRLEVVRSCSRLTTRPHSRCASIRILGA